MSTRWPEAAARWEPNLEIVTVRGRVPARMFAFLRDPAPSELRVFSDAKLQADIQAVADSLPADVRAFEADIGWHKDKGVTGVAVYKTAGGWSLMGGVYYNRGDYGGSVSVRKVWR